MKMGPKKPFTLSHETVAARLAEKGFSIRGNYVDTNTKCLLSCSKGHEWDADVGNVLKKNGTGCPHCSGRARLTIAEVTRRLSKRDIRMVSDNIKSAKKSVFECTEGHRWEARLGTVLNEETGCPHCRSNRPLTRQEVDDRIAPRGYKVQGAFKNASTKADFICGEGHIWNTLPDNVLQGKGCPHCAGVVKYTRDTLNAKLAGRGITLIGEYSDTNTSSLFKCQCGHEWMGYAGAMNAGSGCPACAKYGFDPESPGYFYTMHIYSSAHEYVGFGITKDPDTRIAAHTRNISEAGFSSKLMELYYFDKGYDAKALEDLVKQNMQVVNTGIQGFIREAIVADDYPDMLELMETLRI